MTVLVACRDLMARSKVETTLRHMGLEARTLRASDDVDSVIAAVRPSGAIVDLSMGEAAWRGVVAAAGRADPPLPVLAFGSHVDRASQQTARAAGCRLVVANSRLARELPALMERLLTSPAATAPSDGDSALAEDD